MIKQSIAFPYYIYIEKLCEFSNEVAALDKCSELTFDTGSERFLSPTALVFLAKICRCRSRRFGQDERIFYRGLENHQYANNLGFSEALRISGNPFPQKAYGGKNYFPMSALWRKDLEITAASEAIELGDAIQIVCEGISKVVSQRSSHELENALARSFREIIRNSFEHADVNVVMYCAQYWPQSGKVEICITDRGIGIKESLKENKYLEFETEREALYLSLMPGVSSKAWRHKKKKAIHKGPWDNSGFGLFFAHQLFGELGHFFIASNNSAIILRNGKGAKDIDCNIEGTLVSMSLDLSDEDKIARTISTIQDLAFRVKEKIGTRSIDFASVEAFLKHEIEF